MMAARFDDVEVTFHISAQRAAPTPTPAVKVRGPSGWKCRARAVPLPEHSSGVAHSYGVVFTPRAPGAHSVRLFLHGEAVDSKLVEISSSQRLAPPPEDVTEAPVRMRSAKKSPRAGRTVSMYEARDSNRPRTQRHGLVVRCAACEVYAKAAVCCQMGAAWYCKADFKRKFLRKPKVEGEPTLYGLSFKAIQRTQLLLRQSPSFHQGALAGEDCLLVLQTVLRKILGTSLGKRRNRAIRQRLDAALQGNPTLPEEHGLLLLAELTRAFAADLRQQSIRKKVTRTAKTIGMSLWDLTLRRTQSQPHLGPVDPPPPPPPQPGHPSSAGQENIPPPSGESHEPEEREVFSGDRRADAWMLY